MYTIVGKGFGLYGYLPAIMMNQSNLVLSSEYKLNIEKRKDINQYINRIKWTQSIEESIHLSNNIILAIPPKEQFKFLHEKEINISNKTIFLEKPIHTELFRNSVSSAIRQITKNQIISQSVFSKLKNKKIQKKTHKMY